jgi:hypothetical protein
VTRHDKLPALAPVEVPSVARVKARQARAFLPTEHSIQAGLIQACRIMEAQYPELGLLFAVPNGEYRHPKTAARLMSQGVRAGVPDLLLPIARGRYIGLAIELKRPGTGRLNPAQAAYLPKLAGAGWRVCIHTDAGEALAEVLLYLRLPAYPNR